MPMNSGVPPTFRYSSPELIDSIREVVRETDTPSWLNSVPRNFGDEAAGKLKADEWRSFSTIYFPLALIKAWGSGLEDRSATERNLLKRALDHTMLLVGAITLACYRSTSLARATAYRRCILSFLKDLPNTYPPSRNAHFVPNSHMSVHIFDFLLLFGPVHSWWAFPFERVIGILQRMKSNDKPGA